MQRASMIFSIYKIYGNCSVSDVITKINEIRFVWRIFAQNERIRQKKYRSAPRTEILIVKVECIYIYIYTPDVIVPIVVFVFHENEELLLVCVQTDLSSTIYKVCVSYFPTYSTRKSEMSVIYIYKTLEKRVRCMNVILIAMTFLCEWQLIRGRATFVCLMHFAHLNLHQSLVFDACIARNSVRHWGGLFYKFQYARAGQCPMYSRRVCKWT